MKTITSICIFVIISAMSANNNAADNNRCGSNSLNASTMCIEDGASLAINNIPWRESMLPDGKRCV